MMNLHQRCRFLSKKSVDKSELLILVALRAPPPSDDTNFDHLFISFFVRSSKDGITNELLDMDTTMHF